MGSSSPSSEHRMTPIWVMVADNAGRSRRPLPAGSSSESRSTWDSPASQSSSRRRSSPPSCSRSRTSSQYACPPSRSNSTSPKASRIHADVRGREAQLSGQGPRRPGRHCQHHGGRRRPPANGDRRDLRSEGNARRANHCAGASARLGGSVAPARRGSASGCRRRRRPAIGRRIPRSRPRGCSPTRDMEPRRPDLVQRLGLASRRRLGAVGARAGTRSAMATRAATS
jgi:hypothetical protein